MFPRFSLFDEKHEEEKAENKTGNRFPEVSVCQTEEANGHYRLDILPTDTTSEACRHQSGMHTTSWFCVLPTG